MGYNNPPKLERTYDRLAGKVAFITGATSGIGEAAVRLFAAEGAKVVAAARRVDKLVALTGELNASGLQASQVACDVASEASIRDAVAFAVDTHGRIDLAFNNAGQAGAFGPIHEVDTDAFDRILAVNLRGVFLCMKHEAATMLKSGGGAIVNTSSIGGLIGAPGMSAYACTKWGLTGLTKCAALDYAQHNIRVNAIAPASTRSEMFDAWMPTEEARAHIAASSPMNYIADADDMARAALFLFTEEARWTTGVILPCDGGTSAG